MQKRKLSLATAVGKRKGFFFGSMLQNPGVKNKAILKLLPVFFVTFSIALSYSWAVMKPKCF